MSEEKEYVDVRGRDFIEMYDECSGCKEEFVLKLHLRHKCSNCTKKDLETIFESKEWKSIWSLFDKTFENFRDLFKKFF